MKGHIPYYILNPKDGTKLVLIPGGWFWMGSGDDDSDAYDYDNEKPRHLHYVKPFYFSITCITVEQFGRFVKETGHNIGTDWKKDPQDHPVRYINWLEELKEAGLRSDPNKKPQDADNFFDLIKGFLPSAERTYLLTLGEFLGVEVVVSEEVSYEPGERDAEIVME